MDDENEYGHTLILKADHTLWACGENEFGQLGDGTTIKRLNPVKVMDNVAAMTAGQEFCLVLKQDSTLWAAGNNKFGQLGDGTQINRPGFVKINLP